MTTLVVSACGRAVPEHRGSPGADGLGRSREPLFDGFKDIFGEGTSAAAARRCSR